MGEEPSDCDLFLASFAASSTFEDYCDRLIVFADRPPWIYHENRANISHWIARDFRDWSRGELRARTSIGEIRNRALRCSVRTHCRNRVESWTHVTARYVYRRLLSRGTTIGTINRRLCERGYRRNEHWYKSYLATLDPITYNLAPIIASGR